MRKLMLALLAGALTLPAMDVMAQMEKVSSPQATAGIIEQIIRSKPDLVLEVIRKNPEVVLDAAQKGSAIRREKALLAQWEQDLKNPKEVALAGRPVIGNPDAPVKIIAFSDFTCHFCAQSAQMLESLRKEYGDDELAIIFKQGANEKSVGELIASYFLAIAQQSEPKSWAFHDTVFANLRMLLEPDTPFVPLLNTYAKELGVDMERLEKDLGSEKVKQILTEDREDAKKVGVNGTPFFLVNDLVIPGALPADVFRKAIDITRAVKEKREHASQ